MATQAERSSSFPPENEAAWQQYVEDFRRSGHLTVDWIARYLSHVREYPVLARTKPGELIDALPAQGPDHGEKFDDMLRDFQEVVMPAVTHWNHPGFFAYFACTGSTPAILGEMIAAALNTNGLHWKTSPAVAELEVVALGWLRQWMNLPADFFGIVYDTASVSSFHAICAAREKFDPSARENGHPAGLVMYTSEQSHSSIEKGAIAAGIGQKNVRKIPVDSAFRMRVDALLDAIERDKAAGLKPFCVVATLGTTSSTSVDPINEIADLCTLHNLWLHADTAYAGVCAMLPEYRDTFAGLERADSIVVNPHKWLMTPIDLSAFYTRHPDILARAFSLTPEYLRTTDDPRAHNLLSPGKSILLFCPPIVLAIFGLPRLWRRDRGLALVCGLVPLTYLLLYATYTSWEGIYSYGPRYLVPSAVLLCVAIGAWFLEPPAWLGKAVSASFAVGLLIQGIGLSTNIVEDMVTNHYYDAQWNYQIGYSAVSGQLRLIAKYLGGAPAPLGMGFDRWFLFIGKAGMPQATMAALLIPMLVGLVVSGWLLLREFRTSEAN